MTNTYLLTWNPKRWAWDSLPVDARRSAEGEVIKESWSCGNTKRIREGDRAFLVRLGREPRGVVASGWSHSEPSLGPHWDPERAARGDQALFIASEFECVIDPSVHALLSVEKLRGLSTNFNWSPQASGIEVPADLAAKLEEAWAKHLAASVLTGSADPELSAYEGELRLRVVRHRRREQRLRDAKIEDTLQRFGRVTCQVPGCGFDFEQVYGAVGRRFAHVHHLKPLASLDAPRRTTLEDLAVVCANCHEMIHVGGECRLLEELIARH
ncbi:MAG: HNH endonuclease [Polyangiaceae bacterium]|nr:HNH endonuclease [Polyangiaceae bacterium]MCK6575334.1 HNH endonuclease [Myxococcota bacterium]